MHRLPRRQSRSRQRATSRRIEDSADFCGKLPDDFGAEVYPNSTDGSGLGKSAGKEMTIRVSSVREGR